MPYITYPCWACCSIATERAKCRICSPRPPKLSRIPKPYNAGKPQRMNAISAPILVSVYNWNDYNTEAAQKELDNIRKMITCESCLEQDIPPLTIFKPNSDTSAPSVVLHAAENEYPTMDTATFVDLEHEVDNASDLRILLCPAKVVNEHRGRKRCQKCCEAIQANAYFANAMRDIEAGLVRNGDEQESAKLSRTSTEPEIKTSGFMEPEETRDEETRLQYRLN